MRSLHRDRNIDMKTHSIDTTSSASLATSAFQVSLWAFAVCRTDAPQSSSSTEFSGMMDTTPGDDFYDVSDFRHSHSCLRLALSHACLVSGLLSRQTSADFGNQDNRLTRWSWIRYTN